MMVKINAAIIGEKRDFMGCAKCTCALEEHASLKPKHVVHIVFTTLNW